MYAGPFFLLVVALAFLDAADGSAMQADQRECRFKPKLPKCRRQPPGRLGQGAQCQRDQQCSGGMRCCKVVAGQIYKQCWAPCRRLMEPCHQPTDCVAGLVCGASGVCHKPGQPLF